MKLRSNKPAVNAQSPQVAFRMDPPIYQRFDRLVKVSKRTKSSILDECIEKMLPELEARYKGDLAKAA
jgi:predicted DNA-binding protein